MLSFNSPFSYPLLVPTLILHVPIRIIHWIASIIDITHIQWHWRCISLAQQDLSKIVDAAIYFALAL